jgi:ribonuclease P protein component
VSGLCKSERLRSRNEVQKLHEKGKFCRGKSLNFVYRESGVGRRVAFAVARGCTGAVARNAVKRRLREAYRRQKHKFPTGMHYMLIGKAAIINGDFESLQKEIAEMAMKVAKHGSDSP